MSMWRFDGTDYEDGKVTAIYVSHELHGLDRAKFVPDRPHGEWINEDYGIGECFAECSECGEETNGNAEDTGFGYDYSFPNFCPNCGSDNRREGEQE